MPQKPINRENGGRDTWCRCMALLCYVRTVGGVRGLSTLLLASLVLLLCMACALIRGRETEVPTTMPW